MVAVTRGRAASASSSTVRDTGIGIAPEALALIFEPFRQARRHRRTRATAASGSGSTSCAGCSTRSAARSIVESEVGVGSTFRMVLPVRPTCEAGFAGIERILPFPAAEPLAEPLRATA